MWSERAEGCQAKRGLHPALWHVWEYSAAETASYHLVAAGLDPNLALLWQWCSGSDTEILWLTPSVDKFLQKKCHGRRQSKSFFHISSLLSCAAKQQQHFHSVCSWPWLLSLLQTGELKVWAGCHSRSLPSVHGGDVGILGIIWEAIFEVPAMVMCRWFHLLVVGWAAGKQLGGMIIGVKWSSDSLSVLFRATHVGIF